MTGATFEINSGDVRNVSTTHFGNGTTFRGLVRHLIVYDDAGPPTPVDKSTWGAVKSLFR